MHRQPVLIKRGYFKGLILPVSEYLSDKGFYIPSGLNLSEIEMEKVASTLKNIFK
jgi:perosamine synthetase